jgi:hypothetical protein
MRATAGKRALRGSGAGAGAVAARGPGGRASRTPGFARSPDGPEDPEVGHVTSPTAVAAELLRTGVTRLATRRRRTEIPREDETIRVGDPDDSALANEYVGEDVPGGSTPTPDQNDVDAIGRAYGLEDEDTGALRTAEEVLRRRDRRRSELQAPSRPRG